MNLLRLQYNIPFYLDWKLILRVEFALAQSQMIKQMHLH